MLAEPKFFEISKDPEQCACFRNKNVFFYNGQNFGVEIVQMQRKEGVELCSGEIRFVYKYMYYIYITVTNKHDLYRKIAEDLKKMNCGNKDFDMDTANKYFKTMHKGCTFAYMCDSFVKVGCDYMHVGDEFEYESSEVVPQDIWNDAMFFAGKLYNYDGEGCIE